MSTHLTIKNENRPNPRTMMPQKKTLFSVNIIAGDMICFVVGNKPGSAGVNNLVKRGLWSRLHFSQLPNSYPGVGGHAFFQWTGRWGTNFHYCFCCTFRGILFWNVWSTVEKTKFENIYFQYESCIFSQLPNSFLYPGVGSHDCFQLTSRWGLCCTFRGILFWMFEA